MEKLRVVPAHERGEGRSLTLQPRQRNWDPAERRAAWGLDQSEPGWSVFYGPRTRRFYAIAAWPKPHPLVLDACNVEELRSLIGEAKSTYLN